MDLKFYRIDADMIGIATKSILGQLRQTLPIWRIVISRQGQGMID